MAETTVASAVVVPDPEEQTSPKSPSHKRRQSSIGSPNAKRPRLDSNQTNASVDRRSPSSPTTGRKSAALAGKGVGATEERKRGQRLFGALLGTLSQSSTSAAQRRRADIEKKQQDKLKEKDQELDDERQRKLERVLEKRRKEQVAWETETANIEQKNAFATAHFLKTEATPHLYYKPWELLPEEEQRIQSQLRAFKGTAEGKHSPKQASMDRMEAEKVPPAAPGYDGMRDTETTQQPTTVSESKEGEELASPTQTDRKGRNGELSPTTNNIGDEKGNEARRREEKHSEDHKHMDDHGGEELLEGAEDDVIY